MAIGSTVIKELLENGVHFGHQTNKWNPKMKKYIFGEKSGIYIIDLIKTEKELSKAEEFLTNLAAAGKTVLFVGTKKQAKKIIKEEAQRCEMFYIDERWLGGCLTNFATIKKSVEKLNKIQDMKETDDYASLAKKEKAHLDRVENKLIKNLEGIREMKTVPDCIIIVDAESELIAIKEGRKIGIPVIGLLDTNCDPTIVDFPIPGNDDAIRSIRYIVSKLADAIAKGSKKQGMVKDVRKEKSEDKKEDKEAAKEEKKPKVEKEEKTPKVEEKEVKLVKKAEKAKPETKAKKEEKPAETEKKESEEFPEGDIKLS